MSDTLCPCTLATVAFRPVQPDAYVSSQEVRQHYPALPPSSLMYALERYKEVPGQVKKKPDWATKKTTDAAVKQLRLQATGGETSPSRLPQP